METADLGYADNMAATVTKVSKGGITVKFSVQPVETGRIEWKFVYKPSVKKLKLRSNSARVTSVPGQWPMDDGYGKYFKQNKFICLKLRLQVSGKEKNLSLDFSPGKSYF